MAARRVFLIFFVSCVISARDLAHFPNPNHDVDACGRHGVKSWICDPGHILSVEDGNKLESLLQLIHHETNSDCEGHTAGYEFAIAIVQTMSDISERGVEVGKIAKTIHDLWAVGKATCNDGALVFLSINEKQIYISTGRKTQEKLTNEQIDLIIDNTRPYLRQKQYGKALENILLLSKQVLDDQPLSSGGWNVGTIFSIIMCILFIVVIISVVQSCVKQRKLTDFKTKLGKIDAERENPKEYKTLVCPICLDDFKPETKVKLLICGHKYCESCLSEWLKTKTTCPICRQTSIGETGDISQNSGLREVTFRLISLQNQYPDFLATDILTYWLSDNFHGTFLNDVNQRFNSNLSTTGYDGRFGTTSNFGGGSSKGGGGSGGSW